MPENDGISLNEDIKKALSMMAALESRISTLEKLVALNMTTTTKEGTLPAGRLTDGYDNASVTGAVPTTFFSRGATGWE